MRSLGNALSDLHIECAEGVGGGAANVGGNPAKVIKMRELENAASV